MKFGIYVDYGPGKSSLNFVSDLEHILHILSYL